MTGKKWFLAISAAAFVAWISYLGYAVAYHRLNPPDIVSRSQLTEADYVAVVEVTLADGKPGDSVEVVHRLAGGGPEPKAKITITNLPQATTATNQPLPGSGQYLVALVPDGFPDPTKAGSYKIAGWPRGLGETVTPPGLELKQVVEETDAEGKKRLVEKSYDPPRHIRPPLAYPWSESVQKQMTGLGYKW